MGNTLDFKSIADPDQLACSIADQYQKWKSVRDKKEKQWQEVRNYVFATDTTTTTNKKLPWRNTTTRPKLCQIRDNLHANYMAALFPTERWFRWTAASQDAALKQKAKAIEAYMQNKLRDMQFEEFISRSLFDYIDYGNCFADVKYVTEQFENSIGEVGISYTGPLPIRVSPYDLVLDITASSFARAPKIVRKLLSFGEIEKLIETLPPDDKEPYVRALARIKQNRDSVAAATPSDIKKTEGLVADGFGDIKHYHSSGMVEFLTFEGDLYDEHAKQLYSGYSIVVMDRCYVVYKKPFNSWHGKSTLLHSGWRLRPDNLMAMGPLDNLVGMQYRIDHLENLRADVYDLIAYPVMKQKGYVEDWKWGPNEVIAMDVDSDVEPVFPDKTALLADQQIYELQQQMEEMAGAPKEAMGIRSPGEKTAFEVDKLANAASRMFESKVAQFERTFMEPLLNNMLEVARRNLVTSDTIAVVDNDYGVVEFKTITKDDITAKGRLVPMGARHFATKNRLVQNLTQLSNTPFYQDPAVAVHFSGWKMAQLIEDTLDLGEWGVVQKDVRVTEQMETQQLAAAAEEQMLATSMAPSENPDDTDLTNEINPAGPPQP